MPYVSDTRGNESKIVNERNWTYSVIIFVNFNDCDSTWNSSFWIFRTVIIIFISFRYLGYRIRNSTTLLCSLFFYILTFSYFTDIAIYFHFVLYPFLRYLKNIVHTKNKNYTVTHYTWLQIAKLATLYLMSMAMNCCDISIIIQTLSSVIRSNYYKFHIYMSLTFVILLIIVVHVVCLTMSVPESAV